MRIAPVSGDLLVKVALIVGGAALAVWAVRRATTAAGAVAGQAWDTVAQAVNPWSPNNVAYQTANRVVQSVPGYEQDTLGTFIHRILNPEMDDINSSYYTGTPGWSTGGGRYNNPSAYTPPETIVPDYSGAGVWG
ncbi:hypothetical protein [Acidovorax sp. SUPP2825]|uniref:hypothetical protein n=1 Tax=Acidovorax sp. SUPP2825 TaxID=2920879 RepID=UPI0023DE2577|nr:hypothetical protein [Acidovorax sp. SUPP2825]GKS96780.1 hypothetical protein AVAK2825_19615 [Acidovorax sp. SUPP2825]